MKVYIILFILLQSSIDRLGVDPDVNPPLQDLCSSTLQIFIYISYSVIFYHTPFIIIVLQYRVA